MITKTPQISYINATNTKSILPHTLFCFFTCGVCHESLFFHWKFYTVSILCFSFFSGPTLGTDFPKNTLSAQELIFFKSHSTQSTEIELLEIANSEIFPAFQKHISLPTVPVNKHALVTDGNSTGTLPSMQIIKLLVKLDTNKSAAFILGPTSPTTDIPNAIAPVEPIDKTRFSSGYAFPGLRLDINHSTLTVNFFGARDPFKSTLAPQPKSATRTLFGMAAIKHRPFIQNLPKRYLVDQIVQPIGMNQAAAAVLMTAYIFQTPHTSARTHIAGNIVLTFNEAIPDAKNNVIFIGKDLLDEPLIFDMDKYWLEQWQTFPIHAIQPPIFRNLAGPVTWRPKLTYDRWWPQTWSLITHHTLVDKNSTTYHRDNSSILYMAEIRHKSKTFPIQPAHTLGWWLPDTVGWLAHKAECLVTAVIGTIAGAQTWCSDQLRRFTRDRASTAGARIQFVSTNAPIPPPNVPTTTLVHAESLPLYAGRSAEENAIARLVCQVDGLGCTTQEYETIRGITDLTIEQMHQIRSTISTCLDTPHCPDVNPDLPPIENITPEMHQNLTDIQAVLDAGLNIANATGFTTVWNRKKKLQQPATTLVAAHCLSHGAGPSGENVIESAEAEQNCFHAVQNTRHGNLIVLPPQLQAGGNFYFRPAAGSPFRNYENLIQTVRNADLIPPEFNRNNFAHAIYAIGRDGAPPGENRGIFYLSDATFSSRQTGNRFRYGINHIMAAGSGGGENQGHREDWNRLGITNDALGRRRLAQIIMTALSSSIQPATIRRAGSYTYSRTYTAITVQETRQRYTNIRIVFGINGNIITAYPLNGAQLIRIRSEL